MDYHIVPVEEAARLLGTTPAGLATPTARQRLIEHGPNQLADAHRKTIGQLVLHQLLDVMILVLLAAAGVSGLMGEWKSVYVILAIVVVNAVIGFLQEYRAEKAMEALQKMAASQAQVLRDGQAAKVAAADLVPGDMVLLEAGNIIPADLRFIETHALKVDESSLTGESTNVEKDPAPLPAGDYPLGDRLNLGFKGTFVTNGRATAYVVGTGMHTELGRIATLIQTAETSTPLQKRLATLGKRLAVAALVVGALFFAVGWLRGEPLRELLLVSISLAIAALPEALPALVTISLALGAKRLVDSHALIRKLPAVETLGSVTYICTDKTGTLTLNKMTVEEVFEVPDFRLPVLEDGHGLLTAMALNTDATQDDQGQWLGDSTEVALARYAAEQEHSRAALEARFPRLAELPFDSERKCMSTLHQTPQGVLVVTKGAVGSLFAQLDTSQQAGIPDLKRRVDALAGQGHRVLGYAARLLPELPAEITSATIETGLVFVGFAGLLDPPRPEARQAVAECKAAGITAVMITGDHQLTARAVAESLGIITSGEDLVLTGKELTQLDEPAFAELVEQVRVYARVDPAQKLRIVSALQSRHQFVAMTGDGVNDAPALKNADIGIAMGINGTEVSKEAAHMILLDDDFATIVEAVRHGRRIYGNILKFIRYIMAGSAGEICTLFFAPLFGLPIPLLAIHILWINLITDGLPGLALAYEPSEPNSMKRPPIDPKQTIFADGLGWFIVWVGLLVGGVTIGMQAWAIHGAGTHWQTMTFSVLCFSQLGLAFTVRSRHESAFRIGLFANKPMLGALTLTFGLQLLIIYVPFFNDLFRTEPLTWPELGLTLAVSSVVFWAVEAHKLVSRLREPASVSSAPVPPAPTPATPPARAGEPAQQPTNRPTKPISEPLLQP
ncbi:cation-translocating P-type ATPase [Hymenobacter swuensis]|uniref:Calcium-transporting ATPase n=1 Tax=Hymenobacter swuensis DY53 TaxID=1227739 RepID=W8F5D4_9BACT|nr:cation-translocating P-type ATPase [Hymenobacter swuensis]AHJ97826.1 calcium-transporting ATPase [Hymenobacter swuensis DY53]